MSSGYGRGYYGPEQLARDPRPPGTRVWVKVAVVVGVGAVVWLMWPRRPKTLKPEVGYGGDEPRLPPQFSPPQPPPQLSPPAEQQYQFPSVSNPFEGLPALPPPKLAQEALSRGYPSQEAYEDAVVTSAQQLRETGAQVTLAPHLQHLASRVGP